MLAVSHPLIAGREPDRGEKSLRPRCCGAAVSPREGLYCSRLAITPGWMHTPIGSLRRVVIIGAASTRAGRAPGRGSFAWRRRDAVAPRGAGRDRLISPRADP